MAEISVDAIGRLTQPEIAALAIDLLVAEGAVIEPSSETPGEDLVIVVEKDRRSLLEARHSGRTPLADVSLSAIAARAMAAGVDQVMLFVTGSVDADREAGLDALFSHLKKGTGVSIALVDAQRLAARLSNKPSLRARFFPDERDAERAASAQEIPASLVRFAYAVAPKSQATPARARGQYLRLVWTAAGVLLLIWLPVRLSPSTAIWVGGVGLAVIVLAVGLAHLRNTAPSAASLSGDSVMDTVIPVRDEQARGRDLTLHRLSDGKRGFLWDLIKELPSVVVRASARTALLLFLIAFSFAYLLLWGLDPGICTTTSSCAHAFSGPGDHASAGDFMNLALQAAFFNVPDNIAPASRWARGVMGAEFVLSAVLLGSYAAFFGFSNLRSSQPN